MPNCLIASLAVVAWFWTCADPAIAAQSNQQPPKTALLEFQGDGGSAAGFIGKINERYFVVTNLHVLAQLSRQQARSLTGRVITLPDEVHLIASRDIALVPIGWDGAFLPLSCGKPESLPENGAAVLAWLRQPDSSVTASSGKFVDSKESLFPSFGSPGAVAEITAPFRPGQSGSPIILSRTGEVFAVVAFKIGDPKPRYFGFRLDVSETEYTRVSWKEMRDDAAFTDIIRTLVEHHDLALHAVRDPSYLRQLSGHDAEKHIINLLASHGLWDGNKVISENSSGLRSLIRDYRNRIAKAQSYLEGTIRVGYFKQQLTDLIKLGNQCVANNERDLLRGS